MKWSKWARGVGAPVLVVLYVLCALCSTSYAQAKAGAKQPVVTPSDAQSSLNDEGVRAMVKGDYAGAVAILERSIRLGEINVTYLNLGRAYQKLGQCDRARAALEKAKTAPAVADPSADEVSSVADDYLDELAKQCAGKFSSEHAVAGAKDEAHQPDDATATSPKQTQATNAAPGDAHHSQPAGSLAPDGGAAADSGGANVLGWSTTITGAVLIGGGIAMHFAAQSKRSEVLDANTADGHLTVTQKRASTVESQADRLDTIGLAIGITGGVATAVGTYLLLTSDDDTASAEGVALGVQRHGASVTWTGHF